MTTLILVRHGESTANRQRVFAGHYDAELQDRGLEQAKKTAEYLVKNYKIDKVYASDLKRAYVTGKCTADLAGVEIVPDKDLREIRAGKWDGMRFDDIITTYPDDYGVWMNDIGKARATDGESVAELCERVMGRLTEIATENDGKTIVVATHATPIRVTQSTVQTGSLDEMKNIPWVSNASVSVLEYDNGKWEFKSISEDKHLGELSTSLPKSV